MAAVQNTQVNYPIYSLQNPPATADKSSVESVQDRFLKLLVTQMRNQDPLNPLDNAQVTTQLAQLSTVSGIEKLNANLETLSSNFSSGQVVQAASMIGHEVLAPGSTLTLEKGSAYAGLELKTAADKVVVTIRDSAGKALHTVDLGSHGAGFIALQWDGVTDSGATATDGTYNFSVMALSGDQKVDATTLGVGRVDSVTPNGKEITLNVTGVGKIGLSQVKQIL